MEINQIPPEKRKFYRSKERFSERFWWLPIVSATLSIIISIIAMLLR